MVAARAGLCLPLFSESQFSSLLKDTDPTGKRRFPPSPSFILRPGRAGVTQVGASALSLPSSGRPFPYLPRPPTSPTTRRLLTGLSPNDCKNLPASGLRSPPPSARGGNDLVEVFRSLRVKLGPGRFHKEFFFFSANFLVSQEWVTDRVFPVTSLLLRASEVIFPALSSPPSYFDTAPPPPP